MSGFFFRSSLPASKSILNRALIIQDYFPTLQIHGDSQCDDVTYMKQALASLHHQDEADCGEGGTTLRFLTLRASRESREIFLKANSRLMARPQNELVSMMRALGVEASLLPQGIQIRSYGWRKPSGPIAVASGDSSQYASALLLNAWNLDFDLEFSLTGAKVSESYFAMTLAMVEKLGMQVLRAGDHFKIPAGQKLKTSAYQAEPDLSSSFVFAAAGALFGRSEISHFPEESLQPDRAFVQAFGQMKVQFQFQNETLTTEKTENIQPLEFNLSQSPDLFPVLAVFCSFAKGVSRLYGAPHLAFKESNRIQKVAELFDLVGVRYEAQPDGMIVHGGSYPVRLENLTYDSGHDHRMVMAASLFRKAGYQIHILHADSVNKSLPEFFDLFGERP